MSIGARGASSIIIKRLLQDFLIEQQIQREPHAESGDIRRNMSKTFLVISRRQIHVYPVRIVD